MLTRWLSNREAVYRNHQSMANIRLIWKLVGFDTATIVAYSTNGV
jgi:hypothetical protein